MSKARNIADAEQRFVNTAGDTMTGALNLATAGFSGGVRSSATTGDTTSRWRISRNTSTGQSAKDWFLSCNTDNASFAIHESGVGDRLTIDTSGRVTMPNQPAFRVNKSTTTNALTEIVWNVENLDTGNNFNTTTGRFTAPVAGRYFFSFFGVPQSGTLINLALYVNGSPSGFWINNGNTSQNASCSCSAVVQLNANDFVSVFLVGGNMRTSNGDNNGFMGYLIG